jgi:hypothetical protein
MRIRRAIIPAILSLGAAGVILVGSAAPTAAAQAPAAHAPVAASSAHSGVLYHW